MQTPALRIGDAVDDVTTVFIDRVRAQDWAAARSVLVAQRQTRGTDSTFDVNVRDSVGLYPIQHIVDAQQIELVTLIVEVGGAHIDVIDADGRSLLYTPIRKHWNDMIVELLRLSAQSVGRPVVQITDGVGQSPLHWAIRSGNVNSLPLLINAGADINHGDRRAYTPLHRAVLAKHTQAIAACLAVPDLSINARTLTGETALHLAVGLGSVDICRQLLARRPNVDAQEIDMELGCIHMAIELGTVPVVNLLLDNGCSVDLQTAIGDTPLHIAIGNKRWAMVDTLLQHGADVNLVNIRGMTPAHGLMDAGRWDTIETVLPTINLNMVDNRGITPLYYLIVSGNWERMYDQLSQSMDLDIGKVLRYMKLTTLEQMIAPTAVPQMLALLENSWYARLCAGDDQPDQQWPVAWMNTCAQNEANCRKHIRTELAHRRWYPVRDAIDIIAGGRVVFGTFTGIMIDVAIGLLYLLQRWGADVATLSYNPISNPPLTDFYKSRNITTVDLLNIEVVWAYNNLFVPIGADASAARFMASTCRYLIVPLGIETKHGSHANYLIYDKTTDILERFEPHGGKIGARFNYESEELDRQLVTVFSTLLPGMTFLPPSGFLPRIGFQLFDNYEHNTYMNIGDPGGFCAIWSIWYVDLRLSYRSLTQDKLVRKLLDRIRQEGLSFRNMIRDYSGRITTIRDDLLSRHELDINALLNSDRFTHAQFMAVARDIETQLQLTRRAA